MANNHLLPLHELVFETASEHASRSVPLARPSDPVGKVRGAIAGKRFATASQVAVCEDSRLLGLVSIEDLLAAPDDALMTDIMDTDPPVVASGLDQEKAAWKAVQHGESSLAVVDEQGRYLGLISPRRLLGVLLREHDEDMSRLAGVLHRSEEAHSACEERISRRLWHRLPWLVVGLVGALVSADIVGAFEGQLETNVILAFFLPGVVYLADAVGTQTETLVIRGLSVGIPIIGRVLAREALTGLLIGLAISLIFLPIAILRWGRADVAFAVSLALLAACSMATVVAICLPWVLQRFGRDPAFGSGPLATLIQDLLSIVTYFWIANLLVK